MQKTRISILSALGLAVTLAGCNAAPQAPHATAPAAEPTNGQRAYKAAADESHRQVVIRFRDAEHLNALATAGIDLFEDVDHAHKTVGATITERTEAILKKMGTEYTVTDKVSAMGRFPSGYKTVDQVYADMKALAKAHPDFIAYVEFGKSLETIQGKAKRPMAALHITSKPDADLPAIRLGSGVHARELPPVEIMTRFAHTLADGYGTDDAITKLVDTKDIWIVPLQNPDGRATVEGGETMKRKNTRRDQLSPDGVDINRNADDHFRQGTSDVYAQDYRGSAPFSEPESQALRDLSKKENFDISLDMHAYGGMILWPPGYDTSTTTDEAAFSRIGKHLGDSLGYKAGTIAKTIYQTYGDTATWEYGAQKTLAFAAELDCGSFNPAHSEVDRQWSKWKDALLYLVSQTGAPRTGTATK